MAGRHPLLISEQTLRHQLHQRRLLATVDAGRQMLLVLKIQPPAGVEAGAKNRQDFDLRRLATI
jgi:hypothetical protein